MTLKARVKAGRLVVLAPLVGGLSLLWRMRAQVAPSMLTPALTLMALLFTAALVLLGGLLLRYSIVAAPGQIARRGPSAPAGFSPEDGRPRGGGPGADIRNYTGKPHPRTKLSVDQ